MTSLFNLNPLN